MFYIFYFPLTVKYCVTSCKVEGSIPDGVIRIFHWPNPSGRTMVLGSTQPLTEMSTMGISCVDKGGRCVGLTKLTTFMCGLSRNLGASTSWNPQDLPRPVIALLYLYLYFIENNKENYVNLMCGWPCIVIQCGYLMCGWPCIVIQCG